MEGVIRGGMKFLCPCLGRNILSYFPFLDAKNWTPLLLAVTLGNADLVRILLTHGADVDARDKKNLTPVYVARENGTFQELKELKKRLRYISSPALSIVLHFSFYKRNRSLVELSKFGKINPFDFTT